MIEWFLELIVFGPGGVWMLGIPFVALIVGGIVYLATPSHKR